MPLCTICGLPAAGKTTFAEGLAAFLREHQPGRRVVLVNEEGLHIPKLEGYRDAAAEKVTRGSLRTAVDHALDAKTLVVLDSLNYIKGFRYQLYCAARAQATPHCVVWVEAAGGKEAARQRNAAREDAYPDELFDDLCSRFEAPNEANRWDKPLIRYTSPSSSSSTEHGEQEEGVENRPPAPAPSGPTAAAAEAEAEAETGGETAVAVEKEAAKPADVQEVYRQVTAAMVQGRAPPAGLSTAVTQRAEADALYLLDQVTQKVVASLIDRQSTALAGDRVTLPEASRPLLLTRRLGLPELKRLRRQFVKQAAEWNAAAWKEREQAGGLSREVAVANAFVDYISTQTS